MTLSRRSVLTKLAGLAGASATGGAASVSKLTGLLGSATTIAGAPTPNESYGENWPGLSSGLSPIEYRQIAARSAVADVLHEERHVLRQAKHSMTLTSVTSKRSWSPCFKQHVITQEYRNMTAIIERLEYDKNFAVKVAEALGICIPEHRYEYHPPDVAAISTN